MRLISNPDDPVSPQKGRSSGGATQMDDHDTTASLDRQPGDAEQPHGSHSMWWMVACCAPMALIALAILLGLFGTR